MLNKRSKFSWERKQPPRIEAPVYFQQRPEICREEDSSRSGRHPVRDRPGTRSRPDARAKRSDAKSEGWPAAKPAGSANPADPADPVEAAEDYYGVRRWPAA